MENEQKLNSWLDEEAKNVASTSPGEKMPSMKFEENKIVEFTVDFSVPFQKWTGDAGKGEVMKAIIPCVDSRDKVKKNLWLNVKNPLYSELIQRGTKGQTVFKVIQIGQQANTQYKLVE